ncbi:Rieske (2Fe-2S) protein [Quadrisphaera setariae]|uniref:Cytochrome bc1 complex Rieske iron-sulfur subunit n=1 Tax=Quadrisphaera setariae TaxID=2593304 RepID=A0A5C8ZK05_9ACTN|nr:Rieske (2Fe-2S) protein [Quadrisphaera setariae]TXR57508.1 Rieske (2Fe-2S) protein [Quadrisphaera setariae]
MTTEPQTAESRHATTDPSSAAPAEEISARVLPCSRRALLARAGAGGAVLGAAGLLAACGGTGEPAGSAGGDTASASGSDSSAAGGSGSGAGVAASEVPEGTAVVVQVGGEDVVLAQPTAGQYVAFSAVCTHAGGKVQADQGTEVRCPLHGSVFDAGKDGEVLQGPATSPLPAKTVTQEGDQLLVS